MRVPAVFFKVNKDLNFEGTMSQNGIVAQYLEKVKTN